MNPTAVKKCQQAAGNRCLETLSEKNKIRTLTTLTLRKHAARENARKRTRKMYSPQKDETGFRMYDSLNISVFSSYDVDLNFFFFFWGGGVGGQRRKKKKKVKKKIDRSLA